MFPLAAGPPCAPVPPTPGPGPGPGRPGARGVLDPPFAFAFTPTPDEETETEDEDEEEGSERRRCRGPAGRIVTEEERSKGQVGGGQT